MKEGLYDLHGQSWYVYMRENGELEGICLPDVRNFLSSTDRIIEYLHRYEWLQNVVDATLMLAVDHMLLTKTQAETIRATQSLK